MAAAASLLIAPAAYATVVPGDNGDVKIHETGTPVEDHRNQPKVCTFYLDAFQFDSVQEVSWKIVEIPPTGTKGAVAASGELTLDAEGTGRSEELQLPDGHYKLVWNFDGEHGKAKHKVFWSACEDEEPPADQDDEPSEAPSDLPSGGGSESGEDLPSGGGEEAETPEETPGAGGKDTVGPGEETQLDDNLAETGSSAPVGAIAGAAAALLGVGGYLLFRRRKAGQN